MAKTTERAAAFAATTYCVFLPGAPCELRVEVAHAVLAAWLAEHECHSFAILTAWNPGTERPAAAINAERQSALECDLLEGNYETYAAENVPDDPAAPREESCFVPDIALEDALALAEDYGQDAIIWGERDGTGRLMWIPATE
ncbi:MAG: DUF3293 domain-containing protein [Dechloromonas sp.]|nr:DUF3293 domain-containing protein [Dechloromonas sp.]